jgi:hypothetical protein
MSRIFLRGKAAAEESANGTGKSPYPYAGLISRALTAKIICRTL